MSLLWWSEDEQRRACESQLDGSYPFRKQENQKLTTPRLSMAASVAPVR